MLVCPASASPVLCAPVQRPEVPKYAITIRVTPDSPRIDVDGTLELSPAGISGERVDLTLDRRALDVRVSIVTPKRAEPVTVERLAEGHYRLRLDRPTRPHDSLQLQFSYGMTERRGDRFGLGDVCFASSEAIAWYPRIESRRGTGTLIFDVPAGYEVVSTGVRSGVSEHGPDRARFTFEVSNPTGFSFATGKYLVHQRTGVIPVSLFALRSRPNVEEQLALLQRMLAVLVQEFGDYPHGQFELVEVPDVQTASAFSPAGFVIVNSSQLDALNPAMIAHELGHQWWPGSLSARGAEGRFLLTEAMAQYGALRVVERLYGPEAAERFRRSGYPGYELFQNGLGYLILAGAGDDAPLLAAGHALANSKGFLVQDLLARTIGWNGFRAILRRFTSDFAFTDVTWDMYRHAVTAGAGKPMGWFFEQWYERVGVPEWRTMWSQQGQIVQGSVGQQPPFYRGSIELLLVGPEGSLLRRLEVDGTRTTFAWRAPFRVTEILIDPSFLVPHRSPALRAEAEALAPLGRAFLLLQQGRAKDAQIELEGGLKGVGPEDQYSARFMFRLFLSLLAGDDLARAASHLDAALASATRRQDLLPFAYYTRAKLSHRMNDEERLAQFVANARTSEAVLGVPTGYAAAAQRLLEAPAK
jgi:hypothetical protein